MILSTQSLDELRKSEILDTIIESCPTKIFLASPDMDRDLYRCQFYLNESEVELMSTLRPKQQLLIKCCSLIPGSEERGEADLMRSRRTLLKA